MEWHVKLTLAAFGIAIIGIVAFSVIVLPWAWNVSYGEKEKKYEIRTCQDLQDMNKDLDGVYILMNDIDCREFLNDK